MLTVKHILPDGHESLFLAVSIERTPAGLVFGRTIDSGRVYIMNEAGKTVAMYDFNNVVVKDSTAERLGIQR